MGTPDLRGRAPFGADNMGNLGAAGRIAAGLTNGMTGGVLLAGFGGEGSHQSVAAEQVNHSHSHTHGPSGAGNFYATNPGTTFNAPAGSNARLVGTTDADASGYAPFTSSFANNMPPALVVGFIIAGG
jgi:hypothetical protein